MTKKQRFSILIMACVFTTMSTIAQQKVIYGEDNRKESQEYFDKRFTEASASVAGMVWSKNLLPSKDSEKEYSFNQLPVRLYYNLCKEEAFSEQVSLPTCTAFLVGPDLLLTAGHCVNNEFQCKQNKWVFNYVKGTKKIQKNNTYSCKKLIDRKLISNSSNLKDYALIQLDRAVEEVEPLPIRESGKVERSTPLVVIGHPIGLPLKIADGAKVRGFVLSNLLNPFQAFQSRKNYFITNTDTYTGNSGSPVFNERTGVVEGILIQGKKDFSLTEDDCLSSINYRNKRKNYEEKVFRVLQVENLQEEIDKSYQRTNR
ncbi:serine protease [Halobacteriovorax sp.]|uniref:trypsin-like serine peptidase n=1 Tax=Halobacteriovorax sp. TaxID=2020862 RepID=UPI003561E8EF